MNAVLKKKSNDAFQQFLFLLNRNKRNKPWFAYNSNGVVIRNIMGGGNKEKKFATRAVHVGTKHYEGSVNTPIFQSSTYKLTEKTYAGWAAGAQHTLIYSRLSSVNSEAVAEKLASLENAED